MQRRSALVTGGRSGIGAAIVAALERDGVRVDVLDIADGFDVSDASAWEEVGAVDLACLNAGVVAAEADLARISDEQYRRIVGVNLDGVVFGVRRMAQVMEAAARSSSPRRSPVSPRPSRIRSTRSRSTPSSASSAPRRRSSRSAASG